MSIDKRLNDLEKASGAIEDPRKIKILEVLYVDYQADPGGGVRYLHEVIDLTRPTSNQALTPAELAEYAAAHGLALESDFSCAG